MNKERLIAFTDAVLAIIMTILVLELPKPTEPTLDAILVLKESFFAYTLSFFWLGSMWVSLHNIWHKVDRISSKTIWWNIALLFFASLIPYTTSLVSEYYDNGIIQGFYGIVVILLTITNVILNVVLDEPNKENKELLEITKGFRKILLVDIAIKIVGLIIALTIYPPAMMISVLIAALFITIMKNKI